ncbi:GNAT family N-acetyltransferase [Arthrobacter sp. ISL-72]|uniref:GNAT family N-acetyltransferase n=1 Tax=Arthrobacter sp. ISL-72 TaxID=2819114 RepID=UPI0037BFDFF8
MPPDFPEVRRITRDAYLRAEHAHVWVAEAAWKVVAAVTLAFAVQPYSEIAAEDELEFRMLAVDPAHQGGGVGRAVVGKVVDHARQLPGIEAISITSATFMERAHGLYRSLGFRRAPERDWSCRAKTCFSDCSGLGCRRWSCPGCPPGGVAAAAHRRGV